MGLNEWALESRIRYGLVWGGITVAVVLGLPLLLGSMSAGRALVLVTPAFLIAFLVHAWIWYPRAKRKVAARQG